MRLREVAAVGVGAAVEDVDIMRLPRQHLGDRKRDECVLHTAIGVAVFDVGLGREICPAEIGRDIRGNIALFENQRQRHRVIRSCQPCFFDDTDRSYWLGERRNGHQ